VEPVDLLGDDWDGHHERPGWEWSRLGVGRRFGRELLGASLFELPPGQKSFPYHFHHGQEEWLLVVAGRPTLRTPEGERELDAGDLVVFRRGPDGAHLVRNDSGEPARVLLLSSPVEVEAVEYPDSGKVGVWSSELRKLFPAGATLDYWAGEE
jgi:uncharacterized cupin superfamily protein